MLTFTTVFPLRLIGSLVFVWNSNTRLPNLIILQMLDMHLCKGGLWD